MQHYGISVWKRIPFIRMLLPLIAGIITWFYFPLALLWPRAGLVAGFILILSGTSFRIAKRFRFRWLPGIGLNLVFFALGCLLLNYSDIRNSSNWIGKAYRSGDPLIVTIQEPLTDKPKSYKAVARIESVINEGAMTGVEGKILLYFRKDSLKPAIGYGSQVLINIPLQPVTNSGNPGGFDYKRYCAFQGIYHQLFLKPGDYQLLGTTHSSWFNRLLLGTRQRVLSTLRKYITSKNEVGVAEALLIGYRDDLDRELVQSYSNTGVVHIIAISGLHLGMIYGMMLWFFSPFRGKKWNKVVQPVMILFVLWTFTFLAGAAPSILRSAVMFTCIVLGEVISKKTSVYNALAASAFILLVMSPFYLWDVGFQLSFAAVLSIILFSKHVNNWFYFRNKLLAKLWNLSAITLSAQLLTLPVILYHFHQFPNLFLFTNIIVVPFSGLVLFAELILLLISFIPLAAEYFGRILEWMIALMNTLIERTDKIPFAVTDGIQVSVLQAIFLYAAIITGALWLLRKNKPLLFACCASAIVFVGLRSIDIINRNRQQKLIVYNVPGFTAIDVLDGNKFEFIGDTALLGDGYLRNFHLRPSRIVNRVREEGLLNIFATNQVIRSERKKVIIIDQPLPDTVPAGKIRLDAIIITKNPKLYINQLVKQYDCNLVVFDATNPLWKIQLWKKDCDSLHLRHHSVPEQGAFEMDLR
jgi:competence protein ComEC